MPNINWFSRKDLTTAPIPNTWDALALFIVLGGILALGWTAQQMLGPFSLYHHTAVITLSPSALPEYALRSTLRMFIALCFSLLFTFTIGAWAAKSRRAERLIIPMVDLLQSIPVLGFLSLTVTGFIALFPGKLLGPECAAIFAIFTSQAWNMMLGFYQSLKTLPLNLSEAVRTMHLNAWQRFWRFEVPFAMPGLIWNTMLSLSAGWFFVVASEAISISNHSIRLPGIGSYIALAVEKADQHAIALAIATMFTVIFLYDQLIMRPLTYWAHQFSAQDQPSKRPWVVLIFSRTRLLKRLSNLMALFKDLKRKIHSTQRTKTTPIKRTNTSFKRIIQTMLGLMILGYSIWGLAQVDLSLFNTVNQDDVVQTIWLGLATTLRISICIVIATLLWVPIGVWIGLRPRYAAFLQPIIQFLAAFPANLLFPVVVMLIVKHHLNVNIWTSPLIILGTQWYILFNVIAGTQTLQKSMHYVANLFQLPNITWWRRLILPGIFPHLMTGIISAAGGAWNASIIAEYVEWGPHQLVATGLGGYIAVQYRDGDFAHLALGIIIMCLFVLIINRTIWAPLYHWAQKRCQ